MELTEDDVFFIMKTFHSSDYEALELKIKDFHITLNKTCDESSNTLTTPRHQTISNTLQSNKQMELDTSDNPAANAATAAKTDSANPAISSHIELDHLLQVTSPMLGTFYRSPSPGTAAFVEVGDIVKIGDPLCLIEVMKTYSTISAEAAGKVVRICAPESKMVEADEVLFLIEPSK